MADVVAGVSVAMVLVPQSLAYASLAGVPSYVGLFASALPLIAFSLFASSPYLQTGPTAMSALLTFGVLSSFDAEVETTEYVALAALLAFMVAVVRLIVGLVRLGKLAYLISEPVMAGFTSGAGIVIVASQLHRVLGVEPDEDGVIGRAWAAISGIGDWSIEAMIIAWVTLVLMMARRRLHALFPGVLIAVIGALIYSRAGGYDSPVVSDVPEGLPALGLDLPWGEVGAMMVGALIIGLIGFAEPSALARTFATADGDTWDANREFGASGFANLISSVSGALPVGGSFSRSSLNRFAGATTRWSGGITGVAVLAFLPFAGLLDGLPQAALGAIVTGAVVSLVQPRKLLEAFRRDRLQGLIAVITVASTILFTPRVERALLVGLALTFLYHFARRFRVDSSGHDSAVTIRPNGLIWLGTAGSLTNHLCAAADHDLTAGTVILDLSATPFVDADTAESVGALAEHVRRTGRILEVEAAPAEGQALITSAIDRAIASTPPVEGRDG